MLLALSVAVGIQVRPPIAHNYDLIDVNWRISFDEKSRTIKGTVVNTIIPTKDNLNSIEFHSDGLKILAVSADSKVIEFENSLGKVRLRLSKPARIGKKMRLGIRYEGRPEAGVYFVSPEHAYPGKTPAIYTQGEMEDTRFWLPTYDLPDDKATSEGRIEVPAGYQALSNGRLLEVTKKGSKRIFHWKMDQPHSTYLISFVAGPYDVGVERGASVPVSWYVPRGLSDMGQASFGGTAKMVQFYGKLTGVQYPFAKLAQSAVPDFPYGGMENITAVTQSAGTLHYKNQQPLRSSQGLVLHELAHQWFGDTVTARDWGHIWVNEGFATFLPAFFMREELGEDWFTMARAGMLEGAFYSSFDQKKPMVRQDYGRPLEMFDGNAYVGGAARMHMLMSELGQDVFWKGVKAYLDEYKYQSATTAQFFEVMSNIAGRSLDRFMQQWFYTSGVPDFKVAREGAKLKITQQTPNFELTVDLWTWNGSAWDKRTLSVPAGTTEVDVPQESLALLDPEAKLLCRVTYEPAYTPEQIASLYKNAPNGGARMRLLNLAGESLAPVVQDLFQGERLLDLRVQLISIAGESSRQLLLNQLRSGKAELADASARRLGELSNDEATVSALRQMWLSAQNPELRATAMMSVIQLTKDPALVDEAWRTYGYGERLRVFALEWIAKQDGDRARELCLAAIKGNADEPVRQAAIRALGRLKDKSNERRAYNALVAVASSNSFGCRRAAIQALGEYGDPAALPLLERLKSFGQVHIALAAEEAVKALTPKPAPK